jgi:hypothetical protein
MDEQRSERRKHDQDATEADDRADQVLGDLGNLEMCHLEEHLRQERGVWRKGSEPHPGQIDQGGTGLTRSQARVKELVGR